MAHKLTVAAKKAGIRFKDRDILVVKHKVISKAEGAVVPLAEIEDRGVYFEDPDGHLMEIITRPYGG